jgi:prepilin peptidase CpaA
MGIDCARAKANARLEVMDIANLSTGHIFALALSACLLWVVISDARHYIISNALNLTILGLYVLAAILLPIKTWLPDTGTALLVLGVGLGIFALGLMGGGDVKLLVVLSLWTGWHEATLQFLFLTAIMGGLLVVVVLLMRALLPGFWPKNAEGKRTLPRLLTRKEPVPYGIAIAAAFAWMLWTGMVPSLTPVG